MSSPKLSPDDVDDLIYCARAGDLEELRSTLTNLSTTHNCTQGDIVNNAVDVDPEDPAASSGCSLLHWAAANNHVEVLKCLLEVMGSLNAVAPESEGKPVKAVKGGLINIRNTSGNTALHWAALNGNLECVKLLVYAGADPSIQNTAGKDAVYEGETGELNKNGPPPEVAEETNADKESGVDATGQKEVGVVDWLLQSCEGLDHGLGGETEGEASGTGQASDNNMDVD